MSETMEKTSKLPVHFDAELRDWEIINIGDYKFARGRIYNDKRDRWDDGEMIRTSRIEWIRGDALQTRNTLYRLAPL